jgi:hypothetical protein
MQAVRTNDNSLAHTRRRLKPARRSRSAAASRGRSPCRMMDVQALFVAAAVTMNSRLR